MVFDPQILFNDGFYDLIDVRIPAGHAAEAAASRRRCPAAPTRSAASSTCSAACSGRARRSSLCAAGFSDSPHFMYSGYRQQAASGTSSSRSASAAFRAARSATGRTGIRCGPPSPTCRTNSSRATFRCASRRTRRCRIPAGAGLHRGGNGIAHRLPVPGAGRDLDPRRPLAHLSLGRQRRLAGRRGREDAGPHERRTENCCRPSATASRSSPAMCCTSTPGAAAAGATR